MRKEKIAWAFYDWANSAFATTLLAGFFPLFFKQYWCANVDVSISSFRLGIANSLSGITIALFAPLLGSIADKTNKRKAFLFFFTLIGSIFTILLSFLNAMDWFYAFLFFIISSIAFSASNIFYDSLLLDVAEFNERDFVSSLGYSLGYLGGGLLFSINVLMVLKPDLFNLKETTIAIKLSFFTAGLWWLIFSIPLFIFVKEKIRIKTVNGNVILLGFYELKETFKNIKKYKVVLIFLLAYWFYIDGVDTIIRMAIDYGLAIGFNYQHLIIALLITQFIGFPSALLFGKIGERYGPKTGIFICLFVYIFVSVYAYFINKVIEFYILAIIIGLVQGGVQALSRSLFSKIIPQDKSAEFFGFYDMFSKFAVILGPFIMGFISFISGNPRLSVLSIIILFILGDSLLLKVKEVR